MIDISNALLKAAVFVILIMSFVVLCSPSYQYQKKAYELQYKRDLLEYQSDSIRNVERIKMLEDSDKRQEAKIKFDSLCNSLKYEK